MPEARPPERRPIVPDPDTSLTRARRPAQPMPRLWPLRLTVFLLVIALMAVTWFGWQERQRFDEQWSQLAGEMSNVHARFDAEEGRGDRLEVIESRLSTVENRGESLAARTATLEVEVEQAADIDESRLDAVEQRLDDVAEQLDVMAEEAAYRDALLSANQVSMNALERAGEEGRQALTTRIETVADASERTAERLSEWQARFDEQAGTQQDVRATLAEELAERDEHFQTLLEQELAALDERSQALEAELNRQLEGVAERLEALNDEVEGLVTGQQENQETVSGLRNRLTAMEAELIELRQTQLALSAGLEALQ
ncbi:hypothetical protein [Billgrantia montanilacus]|uniref:Chromosome partition protein Smc n=1 Tax=Billgrantia montanilacus TaxID=2282305 RepID=A0A368TS35_9GAMM|nr:hypothetical protein [Halomonas montanilacus]RCV87428.1 hypothetical protein DU505_16775 [Halomonas montanilacus]